MAVFVGVAVKTAEMKLDARLLLDFMEYFIKALLDILKGNFLSQSEVKILRKTVIRNVAFLDRGTAFKQQGFFKV